MFQGTMANYTMPVIELPAPQRITGLLGQNIQSNFSYIGGTILFLWLALQLKPSRNKLPIMNPKKWYELTWQGTIQEFVRDTKGVLQKALDDADNKPFQLCTNQGVMTVFPPRYINEIRNEPRLNANEHHHRVFFGAFPGFEGIHSRNLWLLLKITTKYLTTNLTKFTKPMAEECSTVMKETLTDAPDWHTIDPSPVVSEIVGRMSTRALLGKDFCSKEWIECSRQYATTLFYAAERFSVWHPFLRPLVQWFLPYCQKLRTKKAECSSILRGVLKQREEARKTGTGGSKDIERANDTITWAEIASNGQKHDPAMVQLSLGLGAIATSTNMLSWFLLCIAKSPESIPPLREEIIGALREGGWKKSSLYNMKLLDSAMKESQRLKPLTSCK